MNKITKKITMFFISFLLSVSLYAQKDITTFLGIPIDGSKSDMIPKLKAKGFKVDSENILHGEFNGTNVKIHVVTNNNKVYRIAVHDAYGRDETSIKIRFNNLCQQFKNNKKYISLTESDQTIPKDEDIAYEINVNKKRYEADFYQSPKIEDYTKDFQDFISTKYTEEEMKNLTEEEIKNELFSYSLDTMSKKSVWFIISENYGKYYIIMYYDNEYNAANGEDL